MFRTQLSKRETEVLQLPAGLSEDALIARVESLDAVRAKGFAQTAEGPRIVQGVGPRVDLLPVEDPPQALLGQLVVIRRT